MSAPRLFVAWKAGRTWTDKCHILRPGTTARQSYCGCTVPTEEDRVTVVRGPQVGDVCRSCLAVYSLEAGT